MRPAAAKREGGEAVQVRIVRLEPLRVACARAISSSPERDAWSILTEWARSKGLAGQEGYRLFGFNNPSPTPGNPVYGYEVWMTAGPEVEPEDSIGVRAFAGGLYAVTRIRPRSGEEISPTWHALHRWVVAAGHRHGSHQWLEEHLGPLGASWGSFEMDLYYPLAE
jgi:AraC family transcriptional regulator